MGQTKITSPIDITVFTFYYTYFVSYAKIRKTIPPSSRTSSFADASCRHVEEWACIRYLVGLIAGSSEFSIGMMVLALGHCLPRIVYFFWPWKCCSCSHECKCLSLSLYAMCVVNCAFSQLSWPFSIIAESNHLRQAIRSMVEHDNFLLFYTFVHFVDRCQGLSLEGNFISYDFSNLARKLSTYLIYWEKEFGNRHSLGCFRQSPFLKWYYSIWL